MKIDKIMLDMDGVLCDFEKKYESLFNDHPAATRKRKEFTENWHTFVREKHFEHLDYFPGALKLLSYINNLKIPTEILSSSGGKIHHDEVTAQKKKWLTDHNIKYKVNIVNGKSKKAAYATPNTILIDDTPEVIKYFTDAGGIGILHKNFEETKNILDLYLTHD